MTSIGVDLNELNPADIQSAIAVKAAAAAAGALDELGQMSGLEMVKAEIGKLVSRPRVEAARREQGLPVAPISLHMIFIGSPGSGKTIVARAQYPIPKAASQAITAARTAPGRRFAGCGSLDRDARGSQSFGISDNHRVMDHA